MHIWIKEIKKKNPQRYEKVCHGLNVPPKLQVLET
jgi:hypothetical protein